MLLHSDDDGCKEEKREVFSKNLRAKYEGKNILITGGAGFIGSHLARSLVKKGANITILDNFRTGSWENIFDIKKEMKVICGDVRNYTAVKEAVKNKNIIFHEAAGSSVPNSVKDPEYDYQTNSTGTFNLLRSMLNSDASLIFASSAAVYGEPMSLPISENHPLQPSSPYGASKLAAETFCRVFQKNYGLKTLVLRYFNVYGPRQTKCVIHDLLKKLAENNFTLEVLGDGNEERDFIHVSDVVYATLLLAVTPSCIGEEYNVGTGVATTVKELAQMILKLLKLDDKTRIIYTKDSWKGDIKSLVADTKKLDDIFVPKVKLKNGMRRTVDWYLNALFDIK